MKVKRPVISATETLMVSQGRESYLNKMAKHTSMVYARKRNEKYKRTSMAEFSNGGVPVPMKGNLFPK